MIVFHVGLKQRLLTEGFRTARVRTLEFVVVPDNNQFLGGYFTSSCVMEAEKRGDGRGDMEEVILNREQGDGSSKTQEMTLIMPTH